MSTKVVLDFGDVSFTEALLRLSLMARGSDSVVKHAGEFAHIDGQNVPLVRITGRCTVIPLTPRIKPNTESPQPAA